MASWQFVLYRLRWRQARSDGGGCTILRHAIRHVRGRGSVLSSRVFTQKRRSVFTFLGTAVLLIALAIPALAVPSHVARRALPASPAAPSRAPVVRAQARNLQFEILP